MSLSLADPKTSAPQGALSPLRRWLGGRDPVRTVFLGGDAAWSCARGEAEAQRFEARDDWLAAHAGGNVRLVLSGTLTHQLVVTDPALPLEDHETLLAWARHQFVHYHGPAAEHWALAPWLTHTQRGASAAHGVDLDALLRSAEAQRVRLRAVQPWWAVALQAATLEAPTLALAEHADLWLVEGAHVTRVSCNAGRLAQIEQHWLERPDHPALAALLTALRRDGPPPWVLGYGLDDSPPQGLPARCLGTLGGQHPAPRWLGC